MNILHPQSDADGWFPHLSPDGKYVAYGNMRTYLTNLETQETKPISDEMGAAHAACMGWLTSSHVGILNHSQLAAKDFWLYSVEDGRLEKRPDIAASNFLDNVNFFEMSNGHWGACQPYGLRYDNRVLNYAGVPARAHGISVNGDWLVTANALNDRYSLLRYKNGELQHEFDPLIPANYFTINERGDILYGLTQKRVRYADGRDEDATTTPWRSESVGISTYAVGDMWVWHGVDNGGASLVVGRKITDKPEDGVIVIEAGSAFTAPHAPNLSVVWNESTQTFTLATCDSRGRLAIAQNISLHEPRVVLDLVIPKVNKNLWCGTFFNYSERYSDEHVPENCTVVTEPGAVARAAANVPIIISIECLDAAVHVKDRVLALYIGDTGGPVNAEIRAQEIKREWKRRSGLDTPVIWYATLYEMTAFPDSVDILGPQFYFEDWNNLGEKRWRMLGDWNTKVKSSKPWIPIYQAYDRNGTWSVERMRELTSIMPQFLSQLIEKDSRIGPLPEILGMLFFAAARPGGMRNYPILKNIYKSIYNAIPGPARWPTTKGTMPNNPPKITITEYTPHAGTAPLRVRAVYKSEEGSGPITSLEWQFRSVGQNWATAAINDPADPDHTYLFNNAGNYEIRLRATGPGGTWETQAIRSVQVSAVGPAPTPVPTPIPEPVPIPAPTPATGLITSLKTASGGYWNVAGSGLVIVGREPQNIEFILLPDHKVALRCNDKYLAAEGGGNAELRFRSTAINGWETFAITRTPEGIGLQAENGKFVCAEREGQGPIIANRDVMQGWETFVPNPPLKFNELKVAGRLRAAGRLITNEEGIFRPIFSSELALCMHSDGEILARLDADVEAGFNGIRVFCGALSWKGQTAEHARERVPFIIEAAHERGLYVQVVALTDTKDGQHYDKREHVRLLAETCNRYDNTLFEIANEFWHPSQDAETNDINYLVKLRREVVPGNLLTALGAPKDDENDPNVVPLGKGDFIVIHLDRGGSNNRDKWNMVRRVREMEATSANYGKFVLDNEPIGAADSPINGKRESDPAIYFCMGALNRIFEVGGCFHSDSGLQGDPLTPQQKACADAFIAGSALIKTKTRMRFQNMNNTNSWPQSPIRNATNVVRAYSGIAEDGSENVVVFVGVSGEIGFEMQNGWRLGEVIGGMPGVQVRRLER
jgi:hypothetical protein